MGLDVALGLYLDGVVGWLGSMAQAESRNSSVLGEGMTRHMRTRLANTRPKVATQNQTRAVIKKKTERR